VYKKYGNIVDLFPKTLLSFVFTVLCLTSLISVLRLVVTALLLSLAQSQELSEIPKDLKFTCEGKTYGYYADISTNW